MMIYTSRTVVSTTVLVVALMFAHTPISRSCSTKQTEKPSDRPDVRKVFLLTWVEEPMNWTTAAARCFSENPFYSMKLATLDSRRMESILRNLERRNITGSTGFWKPRTSGDKDRLCPAISISSDESGHDVNWNGVEDCGNLLGGIMCEGSYIWNGGSIKTPVYCFGIGPCAASSGG